MEDVDLNITKEQKNNPTTLEVKNIAGLSTVTVRWIVSGGKNYTIKVDSKKGGVVSRKK